MGERVRSEVDDRGIATITLDSPANRNALSRQLVAEAHEALDGAEAAGARAVVLTHVPPAFCAGADLKERAAGPPDSSDFVRLLQRLATTERPTIAAVHGVVRAGGIGLMAACDLVVVHPEVTFALTEVRIGVAAAIISVPILARVSPGAIAAAMLTGEPFDAHEARRIGLVTHVDDQVADRVEALCTGILAGAPGAVAATKRLLREVPTLDPATAYRAMQQLSDELFAGPDAAEGMAAFAERRTPIWRST
jgi:enoyl-CoA hydratase